MLKALYGEMNETKHANRILTHVCFLIATENFNVVRRIYLFFMGLIPFNVLVIRDVLLRGEPAAGECIVPAAYGVSCTAKKAHT